MTPFFAVGIGLLLCTALLCPVTITLSLSATTRLQRAAATLLWLLVFAVFAGAITFFCRDIDASRITQPTAAQVEGDP
jgi:hypothetical protein